MKSPLPVIELLLFLLLLTVTSVSASDDPDSKPLSRIALGSCADQNKPQPIWDAISAWQPELFLFLGDNVYIDLFSLELWESEYDKLARVSGFSNLRASCPIMAVWDDHDYGVDDGGAEYLKKAQSQEIFLDFFNESLDSVRRKNPGIYTARLYGPPGKRLQLIMLDTRYFRSPWKKDPSEDRRYQPSKEPAVTILGVEQWNWLKEQLKQPARIRIIASSIQVVNDEHGLEGWANFPNERRRLFNLIREVEASGVFFVSGDRHFAELSRMDGGVGYRLYDFTSSGLTHSSEEDSMLPNSRRVGNAFGGINFGTITIDWERGDPLITLRAHDVKGEVQFSHRIVLSELQIGIELLK